MKVQAQRCPVRVIVALKVVHKHPVHVLAVHVRRAGVHHAARVLARLELVHHQLPDARVAAGRTVLVVAVARVRHLVVERVRPQRRIRERGHHRRVVHEAKLLHHQKLPVPADAQERHPHPAQLLHAHVREAVDNVRLAHHLVEPVLDGGVARPPLFRPPVRNRVDCNLVPVVPRPLHLGVVGVLVGDKERRPYRTPVRVFAARREDLLRVQLPVLEVDRIVEGEQNHLRRVVALQPARYDRTVLGAETVRQLAHGQIARVGRVRIVLHVAPALVRTVLTVDRTVAEVLVR